MTKRVVVVQMRCPHCQEKFGLTQRQVDENMSFTCSHCRKHNKGSASAEADGTLIGIA